DPRPVAGLVVQRGGAHRRPREQKNACITIDSIEPGGSTLPRGRLPLGGCCGVDEPGLSAALDGFPRWYRLSGSEPGRLTSRDRRRRGPLHPRLESTLTVRTTADVDSHGRSGFQSAPGWAERAHADPTSFAPHPSRGPPRSRRAACGLRPARQAESLLET